MNKFKFVPMQACSGVYLEINMDALDEETADTINDILHLRYGYDTLTKEELFKEIKRLAGPDNIMLKEFNLGYMFKNPFVKCPQCAKQITHFQFDANNLPHQDTFPLFLVYKLYTIKLDNNTYIEADNNKAIDVLLSTLEIKPPKDNDEKQ